MSDTILPESVGQPSKQPERTLYEGLDGSIPAGRKVTPLDRLEGLAQLHHEAMGDQRAWDQLDKAEREERVDAMREVFDVILLEKEEELLHRQRRGVKTGVSVAEVPAAAVRRPGGDLLPGQKSRITALENARLRGADAAALGEPESACPYKSHRGGYRNAWLAGWRGN